MHGIRHSWRLFQFLKKRFHWQHCALWDTFREFFPLVKEKSREGLQQNIGCKFLNTTLVSNFDTKYYFDLKSAANSEIRFRRHILTPNLSEKLYRTSTISSLRPFRRHVRNSWASSCCPIAKTELFCITDSMLYILFGSNGLPGTISWCGIVSGLRILSRRAFCEISLNSSTNCTLKRNSKKSVNGGYFWTLALGYVRRSLSKIL